MVDPLYVSSALCYMLCRGSSGVDVLTKACIIYPHSVSHRLSLKLTHVLTPYEMPVSVVEFCLLAYVSAIHVSSSLAQLIRR